MKPMREEPSAQMVLDTRRGTGNDEDEALLEVINRRGEQYATLRWQHYLYLPDEDSAREAGRVSGGAGWRISRIEAMPAPYTGWMLRLARYDVLTRELVATTRTFLEGLAREHQGHYDGWDALNALPVPPRAIRHRPSRPRRNFRRHATAAV